MNRKISNTLQWVGKIDWELKKFHGDELSTHKGSSYNSYLIQDEKTVLIDTVWGPYDREFISNLKKIIDIQEIDVIIVNHSETDHSGALVELMREIPNVPIYCTANGAKFLKAQYHKDWNFVTVKTGDTLSIGKNTLKFIEAQMLHWPDTMFTYMEGENILFSNDGFGQHYASEILFNDLENKEQVYAEALKYYANILTPFNKMVDSKIKQILSMNLEIKMICPSHGIVWRENPMQIIQKYIEWSNEYAENQVVILYDTMWNSTRKMAEYIAQGIEETNKDTIVKLMNITKDDKNDVLAEVFKSKLILVGSPTINNGYSYATAGILEMIKGLKLKNKKATSFGSYGWSGESVKQVNEHLKEAGFEVIHEGLKILWNPDEEQKQECIEFGKKIIVS